ERLPITPNGKVDRRALPAPSARRDDLGNDYLAPEGDLEQCIAAIWAEVLRIEPPSRDDNFFALGGHSLLPTQLASRIRRARGVEVPVQTLFEASSLSGLAGAVQAKLAGHAAVPLAPLVPPPRGDRLPLSFAQQRLWFLDRLEPGGFSYNVPLFLRLRG